MHVEWSSSFLYVTTSREGMQERLIAQGQNGTLTFSETRAKFST